MAKFPEPPDVEVLRQLTPQTLQLQAGTVCSRIFFVGGEWPTRWNRFRQIGPGAGRFDHHLPDTHGQPHDQARGIMYLATGDRAIPTCLAEVFQLTRFIDRHSRDPVLAGFLLQQPLTLLNLRGPFVTAIGASAALHSGPRPRAQRWARQFYLAWPDIDGLLYSSSMYGNAPAVALFERGLRALPQRPLFHRALQDPAIAGVLASTAREIGYGLA